MARKGWDALSPAYRRRLERGGITRSSYEGGANLQKARGKKPQQEYKQRKQRERAKAGEWYPLTPAQIKYLRDSGATDGDLRMLQRIPQKELQRLIREKKKNNRAYVKNPAYKTSWTMQDMKQAMPDVPPMIFWYRSSGLWH